MKTRDLKIGDISRLVGCLPAELYLIGDDASANYRRVVDSTRGKSRILNVPEDRLKRIQRRIYAELLRPITLPPNVHSAPDHSPLTNASVHVQHAYLSLFDIEDCYPSIGPQRVAAALQRVGFKRDIAWVLTRIATVHGELPQGAPTSPAVLNLVMLDIDRKISRVATNAGLAYTRYADDLCLSGGRRTHRLAKTAERILRAHELRLNVRKRRDWGPDDRHTVTGIVVNFRPNASPEYVKAIRTVMSRHFRGGERLSPTDLLSVRGRIAYVKHIDPEAGARLETMFSTLRV